MVSPVSVDYLRISVTERCNLRCIYCNPLGSSGAHDDDVLSFEEICRIVQLCAKCGVMKVRLTGGEPLLRENIVDLVQQLAHISGIDELALTTNGVLLASLATGLRDAGLTRVNVSLDATERPCFEQITGIDALSHVVAGIDKAIDAGLTPLRVNCVVIKDVNLSQVLSLAEMSVRLPVAVRFIEYSPTDRHTRQMASYVPNSEIRAGLESRFGVLSSVVVPVGGGPAIYYRIPGAIGTIGFISSRSSVFCGRCNRLRLTADGQMMPCLHSSCRYDLKKLLRNGTDDRDLLDLLQAIIREKHRYTRLTTSPEDFLMQNIGG